MGFLMFDKFNDEHAIKIPNHFCGLSVFLYCLYMAYYIYKTINVDYSNNFSMGCEYGRLCNISLIYSTL